MGTLDGRVVLLTGGGNGIGASCARILAAEGAAVVVNDLGVALDGSEEDRSAAQRMVDEITAAGGRALADGTDVSDYDGVGALVERTVSEFGGLDVVAHTAGILRDRMIFNMAPEEWDAVHRVHLRGLFNLTRHAAGYWRQRADPDAHSRLITFTSRSGLNGAPTQPNYAAAKMGVVGFTYSCARALTRYGATATAICPTAATRMTASQPKERQSMEPGSAEGSPDNIARVVAYVAGPQSDWLNGEVVGAKGFEVSIYSRPHIVERVTNDGAWDLAALGAAMEASLQPHATGPTPLS